MTLLGDIGFGTGGKRHVPAPVTLTGSAFVTSVGTRVAVPPVETREGSQVISSQASGASGDPSELNERRAASTLGANSDASVGCGWRLVYESELKQVFLDLVERDGDTVMMRIPRESLVRFLRGVADAESARHSAAEDAQLDLRA